MKFRQIHSGFDGRLVGHASQLAANHLKVFLHKGFDGLLEEARAVRDAAFGHTITYSRKVFIPLTRLCRDSCGYCTFARRPRKNLPSYLSRDAVLDIARRGAAMGCTESLFTLGDRPEDRYEAARTELHGLGHDTTVGYLAEMSRLVTEETSLLAHVNPGVLSAGELTQLRSAAVSQGLMLETASTRLTERGSVHYGAVDKHPHQRLATIAEAGRLKIPYTSGILIGIGETRLERLEALIILNDLHRRFGHLQEVIVQNFRAKENTPMAGCEEPDLDDLLWTIAAARLVLDTDISVQAPPNLSFDAFPRLLDAGINDWGGVSPVTPDHVNPEARWPQIDRLRFATEAAGKSLVARLPVYPRYATVLREWVDPGLVPSVLRGADTEGFARQDPWSPGQTAVDPIEPGQRLAGARRSTLHDILYRAERGEGLDEDDIVELFSSRDADVREIVSAADEMRARTCGDDVSYVVTRNINYTNICSYRCRFCAFAKGKTAEALRGKPYNLPLEEVERRVSEAWSRGATEVCMQGGIHPEYTGETYLELLKAAKRAEPRMHVHAFSPLEVAHGAQTMSITVKRYPEMLKEAGLGSLPGTAAEILDDEVRAILCPDKLSTGEWLAVVEAAHQVGLRTTSTIMFGHMETTRSWARHLIKVRELQLRTGGITEFVPLPFIHMEAPIYLKGGARRGPTWRETLLMHAVSRLALHGAIDNIQASWVKLGPVGARHILKAGVNDLGGTLMNESISKAAGNEHGQEFAPSDMEQLIRDCARRPRQRNTLYADASKPQRLKSFQAAPLESITGYTVLPSETV
jgi:FO synthase